MSEPAFLEKLMIVGIILLATGVAAKSKPIEALFLEFQDSGLLFKVRCWIEHFVETRRVIDKLNTALYQGLNEADIEIPFPQHLVHIYNNGAATEMAVSNEIAR